MSNRFVQEGVDWRFKGMPVEEPPRAPSAIAEAGWRALEGDLHMPVLLLKEEALAHNLDLMRSYCEASGCSLAPHGKTTMSPQLIRRQLDAGAWGITAATVSQARVLHAWGVPRVIIANQVVDAQGLRWIAEAALGDDGFELYTLVDSVAGVRLLDDAIGRGGLQRSLPVFLELGLRGRRTGCRTVAEGLEVASAVAGSKHLRLAGVEGFEGVAGGSTAEAVAQVDAFTAEMRRLAEALVAAGHFAGADEVIVSAGGSAYFDRVVAGLGRDWNLGRPVRLVLRSGCYLTHDHGHYDVSGPLGSRLRGWPALQPALELWGAVLSTPEPGLAILGIGKRDSSHDIALPRPLHVKRPGRDGLGAAQDLEVFALNDQHAYVNDPRGTLLVGDLVGCGIAHPCTIFDKWRLIPVVDAGYRVIDAVETFF